MLAPSASVFMSSTKGSDAGIAKLLASSATAIRGVGVLGQLPPFEQAPPTPIALPSLLYTR